MERVKKSLNSNIFESSKSVSDQILDLFRIMDEGSDRLGIVGFGGELFQERIPSKIHFLDLRDKKFFNDITSKIKLKIKPDNTIQSLFDRERKLNPIIKNLLIMDSFDFTTDLNVNILGRIFEQSISDLEELKEENILFEKKEGALFDWLNNIDATSEIWRKRNKSTDIFAELKNQNTILVHNTFTKKEDLTDNYYCTCPKANLYIENSLPDYSIFDRDKLCVGTDSLASNNSLSVLEELRIIQENYSFDLNTLLKIASKNGAKALGFEDLGTFEKGKIPGVNLIKNFIKGNITKII